MSNGRACDAGHLRKRVSAKISSAQDEGYGEGEGYEGRLVEIHCAGDEALAGLGSRSRLGEDLRSPLSAILRESEFPPFMRLQLSSVHAISDCLNLVQACVTSSDAPFLVLTAAVPHCSSQSHGAREGETISCSTTRRHNKPN